MNRLNRLVAMVTPMLHRALGSRAGSRVGILAYHRVQPLTDGLPEPTFNVTPQRFRTQLAGLADSGYRFVRLQDVIAAHRQGATLRPKSVVVTFDDAFESVYHHAYPVLQELRIPAVAFLSTAYLDSRDPFPFDRWGQAYRDQAPPQAFRPLSVEQCHEMAADGLLSFGAHTHTHEDFRGRPHELRRDVRRSADMIRDLFAADDVMFAFPYGKSHLGYAGGAMSEAARASGVCCALTTDCTLVDPSDDPFAWGRFSASNLDTPQTLAAKLAGWYGWAPRLQQWLDRVRGYDRSVEFDPPTYAADPCHTRSPVGEDLLAMVSTPHGFGGASCGANSVRAGQRVS